MKSQTVQPVKPGEQDESGMMELAKHLKESVERTKSQIHQVIIGQDAVIDQLLTALFAGGHCLIVGVPGLAKTLLIKTLSETLQLSFKRIQFTPDLMPTDIVGTELLEDNRQTGKREFVFVKGPVFAQVILADEINRTPPKTQAALLEAMQEHQVTASGHRYTLEEPFFVLATQNPIEQEGTYPLPEAQLDRFMFQLTMGYPTPGEEREIALSTTSVDKKAIQPVLDAKDILALHQAVRRVPVSSNVIDYTVRLVSATRPGTPGAATFMNEWVSWGAGPRASQYLVLAGKARALMAGRFNVAIEDIRAVTLPVLRHRVLTNFKAEAEGIKVDELIGRLIQAIPE